MSRSTAREYLDAPYGRLLVKEPEGGFSAEIVEFPGCVAEGETADEAMASLERAATAWIESELEQNHEIPEPAAGVEYSGRVLVRLPRSLHRGLALKAQRDNTSLNQEVVTAVAIWLGADDLFGQLTRRAENAGHVHISPIHSRSWSPMFGGSGKTHTFLATVSGNSGIVINAPIVAAASGGALCFSGGNFGFVQSVDREPRNATPGGTNATPGGKK